MNTTIYKSIALFFLFASSVISGISQPISSVRQDDKLTMAEERMDEGDYFNALDWFRQYYREEKNADVGLSIAYAYYKLRDYENANRYYQRILEDDVDNIFIDDRYAYGRSLRSLDLNGEAREQFDLLMALSTDEELKALAQNELDGMDALNSFERNEKVVVNFTAGDFNKGAGEYSPAQFDENTLYFTSFDRNKEVVIDGKEKDYHVKAFMVTKEGDGYGKAKKLHRNVNRDGFHVGNLTFTPDKRRMFFTRQMIENDVVTMSRIYYSDKGDDKWGAAELLTSVNGEWIAKQPAMGELLGRRVLYFVSDMEGGYGGDDIYYVTINGESIGPPVNLGETINTAADEVTPSYHDGKLYFSTDIRPGLGGYDIYHTTWDGSQWSRPKNLGLQYNTPFDDYYFNFNEDGFTGYLVSNRPDEKKKKLKSETCCYDIYNFEIKQLLINLLVGVGDEATGDPLDGATVELADQTLFDSPRSKTLPEEYRFNFDLNAERKYRVITSREGYISDTLTFTTDGITEDEEIRKRVMLKKKAPPPPDFVIETVTINEAIRFDNIYYEFDKWDILPESEDDLNIILGLMNEYSDMVIELSSHTDARGPTPYNKDLSQKRAESAKAWLVEKGVATERIEAVGYGESKILNRCINGVRCPDDEHRFNRRTEFKIIAGPQTIEIKREVKKEYKGGGQSFYEGPLPLDNLLDSLPVITFEEPVIALGTIKEGEKRELVFEFENTGAGPLVIDLATSCKCTEVVWPTEVIPPGGKGKIEAVFNSTDMEGYYDLTIDIIANTNPLVVEAKYNVEIVPTD